jgi:hypothetical protein
MMKVFTRPTSASDFFNEIGDPKFENVEKPYQNNRVRANDWRRLVVIEKI